MLRNPISAEIGKELVRMDFYVLKNDEEDGYWLNTDIPCLLRRRMISGDIGFNFAVTDECDIGGLRDIHLILSE